MKYMKLNLCCVCGLISLCICLNSLFICANICGFLGSPFEVEDSVKFVCLPDLFVDPINVVLRRLGNEELCCGSLV